MLTAHPYAHLPALASAHDEYTDPELYHQAAQKLHYSQQEQQGQGPQPHAPKPDQEVAEATPSEGGGKKYDTFESHFANHAQAYGCVPHLSNPFPFFQLSG